MENRRHGHSSAAAAKPALWRWVLWLAFSAGLIQAALVAAVRYRGRLVFQSADDVWMAPLANILFLGAAALAVRVVTRGHQATRRGVTLPILFFLFFIGPILIVPGLHYYAALTLAAGLAAFATRVVQAHLNRIEGVVRLSLPALFIALAALGVGLRQSPTAAASRAEAAGPTPASPSKSPNVLLIVLDTVRAQNLSLYGYARATSPHLDRIAESSVVFERAISTAPWTLPSHATMFTGRYPHELNADWLTPLDGTHPVLAEAFRSRGYKTAGFVGNLIYTIGETGLNRGFIEYSDHPMSAKAMFTSSFLARALLRPYQSVIGDGRPMVRKGAAAINGEFIDWLSSHRSEPFLAFLNYFDAHVPISPPAGHKPKFGLGYKAPDLESVRYPTPESLGRLIDAYDNSLTYVDDQLKVLFDALSAQGVLDNTLVVVTSDHGEQLGEHGLVNHGNSLYRPLLAVPLLLRLPGRVPSGLKIRTPVSLVDLSATILAIAGLTDSKAPFPGRSLSSHWDRSATRELSGSPVFSEVTRDVRAQEWVPMAKGPMQSLIADGLHYIRNGDGREELYDFDADAPEVNDLSRQPGHQAALQRLRKAVDELVSAPSRSARLEAR